MKTRVLFIIIIITSVFSCIKEYSTGTTHYIKNNSGHYVDLTIFDALDETFGTYHDTTYLLPNNFEIKYSSSVKGGDSPSLFPFSTATDSAYVVFDDSLRIIYRKGDGNPRNVLDNGSYSGGKKDDDLYEFYYSITPEDYENAELIH